MSEAESIGWLEYSPPPPRRVHPLVAWLARLLVLVSAGVIAFYWCALSPRALLRFDRSSIEGWEPYEQVDVPLPVHAHDTLMNCLGPVGWITAFGVFGLAGAMALSVHRWPWALRMMVAAAPPVLAAIGWVHEMRPALAPAVLLILLAELMIALLAAGLAGPSARCVKRVKRLAADADAIE